MSFIDDVGSQNTQLYPIVTIEGSSPTAGEDVVGGWIPALGEVILLSTNNVSLDHIYKNAYTAANPEGYAGYSQVNQQHFKPLLLNIPSIKESIDIESKKFKISSVSLDISNIEYEGKRFTDIFSDTSLINSIVSIQFVSTTANMFSTIRPIINFNNTGQNNSYSFYQGYSGTMFEEHPHYGDPAIRAKMTQMVYQGVIRRISHDDTKVKIELEDLTEKLAHKDLPQALDQNGVVGVLGEGESISSKYRNKPIPMVYGHVDRSPIVFDGSVGIIESKDVVGIQELVDDIFSKTLSGLMIDFDKGAFYVPKIIETMNNSMYHYGAALEVEGEDDDIINLNEGEYQWEEISENRFRLISNDMEFLAGLQLEGIYPSETILETYLNRIDIVEDYDALSIENKDKLYDKNLSTSIEFYEDREWNLDLVNINRFVTNALLKISKYPMGGLDIVSDLKHTELSVNYVKIPTSPASMYICRSEDVSGLSSATDVTMVSPDSVGDSNIDMSSMVEFNGSNDGASDIDILAGFDSFGSYADSGGIAPYLRIDTGYDTYYYLMFKMTDKNLGAGTSAIGSVDGKLTEIWGYSKFDVKSVRDKDFYANVKGRINTDNAALGQRNNPNLGTLTLIENPIDIIYDLVRSELGHGAINQAEYLEAKAAHKYLDANNMPQDWKFGFVVNKKINSKKLIEDIAKSTKCFPKFKNDGTFGFNTIKDYYNATDISSASLIKESEVISYSFKKTKPEQIYKKITVSYDKDYAQDSYLKTALSEDLGDDPYYGIENSSDAHLEFESDYIKHDVDGGNTANALAQFLLWNYKNDHLVFNLKLPLQYINLEVGSLVKLNLFDEMRAFGIDYTVFHMVNGQYRLPVFMITSSTKNLNSVSIECMQLHDSGEYQAELDEQAAALAAELAAQAEADAAQAEADAAELAEEAIIMQPPVITIANGNQTVQAGDVFTLPTATAIDAIDGALPVTTSYSDSVVFINISSNLGVETAIAPNLDLNISIQVQFEATDSSNVTGYASTSINIVQHPSYNIFDMSVFDGYRTFAINGFHYGGEPETDISGLENAFWFLFYHDLDAITGNHFFQDTNYNKYVGGREIFKILQVNGLPNANDNGLYYMAAEFVSAEDSGAFYDNHPLVEQYASANDPHGDGTNYISVYPNHQLCFQKINMTQNVYNPVTGTIETTTIGDYTNPVAGAWLTEPEVDNNHTMGANIFQDNVGVYWNGQMVNPENISGEENQDWISPYVYPALPGGTPAAPLIIGGYQDMVNTGAGGNYMPDQFVGGISMHETTSIELIDIPTEPIYNVEGILGDSNTDGFLNILDLVATVHFILGTGDLSTAGQILADSNQDNSLNILDIVGTVDTILGID